MPELHIPADDFQIGDIVHLGDGQDTEIRALQRGERGRITVNPGDFDEITGYIWHHATVTRKETPTMTDIPTLPMTDKRLRVLLPDGIGYVEIRTGNVHGPTGYPVVGVELVSYALDTPARDGRLYEPARDRDNGVVLIGRPGPKLAEQERQVAWFERVIKKHDSGDHTECPETCPAKEK
jgi:hypothetical protein